ncbi:hypothetical protein Rs2_49630 [Raphanus sativus]|nr:hypothetical protein Rs2_49630 [Raphanus sativus]
MGFRRRLRKEYVVGESHLAITGKFLRSPAPYFLLLMVDFVCPHWKSVTEASFLSQEQNPSDAEDLTAFRRRPAKEHVVGESFLAITGIREALRRVLMNDTRANATTVASEEV